MGNSSQLKYTHFAFIVLTLLVWCQTEPVKIEWWAAVMVICPKQGANDCTWSSWCH